MIGLILDTGALIALERGDRRTVTLIDRVVERGASVTIPSACVAQAWRGGARQTRIAALLRSSTASVAPLDGNAARKIGRLLATAGTNDIVDGQVAVLTIETGHPVVTSDPDDIRRLAPLALIHRT